MMDRKYEELAYRLYIAYVSFYERIGIGYAYKRYENRRKELGDGWFVLAHDFVKLKDDWTKMRSE